MIRFASDDIAPVVRQMWQTCFGDSDQFMDLFFEHAYCAKNTLIYWVDGEAAASLHMLPYTITFYGKEIPCCYLAGLCTMAQHREKGYMSQLIRKAHKVMKEREIPLSILIPAKDWLWAFYEKYGYEQVFEKDDKPLPSLQALVESNSDLRLAYSQFDELYRSKDFCMQKSFDNFVAILKDAKIDNYPIKCNLSAMAHLVDAEYLLSAYAMANTAVSFVIEVENICYEIKEGKCAKVSIDKVDLKADIRLLCRLLFGYKIGELPDTYQYFLLHEPIINMMLE